MTEYNLLSGLSTAIKQDEQSNQLEFQSEMLSLLDGIFDRLGILQTVRDTNGTLRVYLRAGDTLNTVTTVSTVSNIASHGGYAAQQLIPSQQNLVAAMSNISTIVVS